MVPRDRPTKRRFVGNNRTYLFPGERPKERDLFEVFFAHGDHEQPCMTGNRENPQTLAHLVRNRAEDGRVDHELVQIDRGDSVAHRNEREGLCHSKTP
jgi:hypothetical protein